MLNAQPILDRVNLDKRLIDLEAAYLFSVTEPVLNGQMRTHIHWERYLKLADQAALCAWTVHVVSPSYETYTLYGIWHNRRRYIQKKMANNEALSGHIVELTGTEG